MRWLTKKEKRSRRRRLFAYRWKVVSATICAVVTKAPLGDWIVLDECFNETNTADEFYHFIPFAQNHRSG